jgi:hypothetical protein
MFPSSSVCIPPMTTNPVEPDRFLVCRRSIPWALAIHHSACSFATLICTGEGWMGHVCKDLTQASAAHHPAAHPVPQQYPRAKSSGESDSVRGYAVAGRSWAPPVCGL